MGIVTAAAGRRDGYQVPVAFAEAGLLAAHVTDQYLPDALQPLLERFAKGGALEQLRQLSRRHHPQLPSRLVHCSRRLVLTKFAQRLQPAWRQRWSDDQDPISWSALRLARQQEAALLLHMGYAHHAFMAEPLQQRRRGLVQYHPHIAESARILQDDLERYPELSDAREQLRVDAQDFTNREELERADLVICNSSFTAQTCSLIGVDPRRISVVPFGIDPLPPPSPEVALHQRDCCRFLFVGSGLHRKGLHHLLEAWGRARLMHSRLTLVCRYVDPQIRSNFSLPNGVELQSAVSQQQLERLYSTADVFVLPSLVEGFGYVYLEALARGCFCLGTFNTGLPDVAAEGSTLLISASKQDALAKALRDLEAQAFSQGFDRQAIAASVRPWTWARFRQQLVDVTRESLLGVAS